MVFSSMRSIYSVQMHGSLASILTNRHKNFNEFRIDVQKSRWAGDEKQLLISLE